MSAGQYVRTEAQDGVPAFSVASLFTDVMPATKYVPSAGSIFYLLALVD